ncbi:hypothetical protein HFN62_22620 [Rhizobium leguminosarum]|uniref:hypothetical protein n=1 Tax=Rhizobium leguminosarum TaxID=384 RepID=UPI001C957EFB|nr:hypothetical protein [Rhizobium leguminosarum]MBY5786508.1 hypothetical protein [Rhizobium leguminosarum]
MAKRAGDFPRVLSILEHDAEKCTLFLDDIMLYLFDLAADSDFRPVGFHYQHLATGKNALQLSHLSGVKRLRDERDQSS